MAYEFTDPKKYPYRPGHVFFGRDEDGHEVGMSIDRGIVTVGGARSGKGAALLVQNARKWTGTVFCIDTKGENAKLCYQARLDKGQACHVIDPFHGADVPPELRQGFNPLADIDPNDWRARSRLLSLAEGLIISHNDKNMDWTVAQRIIAASLMALMLDLAPPEYRSFAEMRRLMTLPRTSDNPEAETLHRTAAGMQANTRPDGLGKLIRQGGSMILDGLAETNKVAQSALGDMDRATSWLDDDPISACLAGPSIDLNDLKTGKASVFVVIPPDFLKTHAAFLRLLTQCAVDAMMSTAGRNTDCLFLLDEFYALGKLDTLDTAVALLPGLGVFLWPFVQTFEQLDLYSIDGKGGPAKFLGNADAAIFLGIQGDKAAKEYISDRLGPMTQEEAGAAPHDVRPFVPSPKPAPLPYVPMPKPPAAAFVPNAAPNTPTPPRRPHNYRDWSKANPVGTGWFDGETDEEGMKRMAAMDESAMRQYQDNTQGIIRNWQNGNAAAEAAHRAVEDQKVRDWESAEARRKEGHTAREKQRLQEWEASETRRKEAHDAATRSRQSRLDYQAQQAFKPRLTPHEVETLTGKPNGEQLARSMIVFARAGDVLNIALDPYFKPFVLLPSGGQAKTNPPPPKDITADSAYADIGRELVRRANKCKNSDSEYFYSIKRYVTTDGELSPLQRDINDRSSENPEIKDRARRNIKCMIDRAPHQPGTPSAFGAYFIGRLTRKISYNEYAALSHDDRKKIREYFLEQKQEFEAWIAGRDDCRPRRNASNSALSNIGLDVFYAEWHRYMETVGAYDPRESGQDIYKRIFGDVFAPEL